FVRVVADHHNFGHALCGQLTRNLRHAESTVDRLATGHRYRVVVKNLIGDRYLGSHSRADRQQPGVEVGAVAEIGEHMLGRSEGRLADPRYAFATHLAECLGLRVNPGRHVVATDPRQRSAAFGNLGGGVVRAAGAVVRYAIHQVDQVALAAQLRFQDSQADLQLTALIDPQYPPRQRTGNLRGRELTDGRQQPVGMWPGPFAFVVELADDDGAHILAPVVEF